MRVYGSRIGCRHPASPPCTAEHRPNLHDNWPRPSPEQWGRYLGFMFGQVRELLTNYGTIDLLWFDGQWEHTPEEWRAAELAKMIRELQPRIVINDRLPGGDYETPEQFVPARAPEGQWEVCLTMNESWGYNPSDTRYKPARAIVHTLCEIAGKGGHFLLNVGPDGDGVIPTEQTERLDNVAAWMSRCGEAIHGSGAGLEPWQFYGPSTRKGDTVYLHLLMRPYETVTVRGVPIRRVRRVRALTDGRELVFETRCAILDQLLNSDPMGELTISVPEDVLDPLATVLAIEIAPNS